MISLKDVRRHYAMKGQVVHALSGIDLDVGTGEFVTITGASGSGKSSLLNILGCLDRPSSGSYALQGRDVGQFDDETASEVRNSRIGFVFQSFHLLPRLTVLENVLLPLRFHRAPPPEAESRAHRLLDRVGLGDRAGHLPAELSGGQMQRAAIARALLLEPALLLADEPTGNLDSRSATNILEVLAQVHAAGQTVVMVTHDNDIARSAPRQVHLRDGKIEHDSSR